MTWPNYRVETILQCKIDIFSISLQIYRLDLSDILDWSHFYKHLVRAGGFKNLPLAKLRRTV